MATPEQTAVPAIPRQPTAGGESAPVDFIVLDTDEQDSDSLNPRTIEAYWNGEAKVSAEVDFHKETAHIDRIMRPAHWGEDWRPLDEQQAEYELSVRGIFQYLIAQEVEVIEVDEQSGVAAAAVLEVPVPPGWLRTLQLIKYDVWVESEVINIRDAVAAGAIVSARYEKEGMPETESAVVIPLPVRQ